MLVAAFLELLVNIGTAVVLFGIRKRGCPRALRLA